MSYPTNRRLLRPAALALAEMGIPVFRAATNKRPLPEHGFKDASADPAVVREMWRRWPGPLVGVATGGASAIDVLDLDRQHGAARRRGEEFSTYKDKIYVSVRIWYLDEHDEMKPTSKGINVKLELLPNLAAGINQPLEAARADGLVE